MDRAGAQARIIQLAIFALAAGGWYFVTAAGDVNRLLAEFVDSAGGS